MGNAGEWVELGNFVAKRLLGLCRRGRQPDDPEAVRLSTQNAPEVSRFVDESRCYSNQEDEREEVLERDGGECGGSVDPGRLRFAADAGDAVREGGGRCGGGGWR